MTPPETLLAGLATRLGQALAFADDASEMQRRVIGFPSTRTALSANARSFAIGSLRKEPVADHHLLEKHTDLNKVVLRQDDLSVRYWLKSEAAVLFTFAKPVEQLFPFPSDLHVLTFVIDGAEVVFRHAPVSRLANKKYKLESELKFAGHYPLGGVIPPGGYPPGRARGVFDGGDADDFDDMFDIGEEDDGEEKGEASA